MPDVKSILAMARSGQAGIEGATTWELRAIANSSELLKKTDFFRNGIKLTGKELEEALKPWQR